MELKKVLFDLGVAKRRVAKGLKKHGQTPTADMSQWGDLISNINFGIFADNGEYLDATACVQMRNTKKGEINISLDYIDSDVMVVFDGAAQQLLLKKIDGDLLWDFGSHVLTMSNYLRVGRKLFCHNNNNIYAYDLDTNVGQSKTIFKLDYNGELKKYNDKAIYIERVDGVTGYREVLDDLSLGDRINIYTKDGKCPNYVKFLTNCIYVDAGNTATMLKDNTYIDMDRKNSYYPIAGVYKGDRFIVVGDRYIEIYTSNGKYIKGIELPPYSDKKVAIEDKLYIRIKGSGVSIYDLELNLVNKINGKRNIAKFESNIFFIKSGELWLCDYDHSYLYSEGLSMTRVFTLYDLADATTEVM